MGNERTRRRNINGHDEFSLASLVLEPLSMLLKRNFHPISLNSFEFNLKWNLIVLRDFFHRFDRCHSNTHHFLIIGSDRIRVRLDQRKRKEKRKEQIDRRAFAPLTIDRCDQMSKWKRQNVSNDTVQVQIVRNDQKSWFSSSTNRWRSIFVLSQSIDSRSANVFVQHWRRKWFNYLDRVDALVINVD